MLTSGHLHDGRFHINVLCFCVGSALLWGFCFSQIAKQSITLYIEIYRI